MGPPDVKRVSISINKSASNIPVIVVSTPDNFDRDTYSPSRQSSSRRSRASSVDQEIPLKRNPHVIQYFDRKRRHESEKEVKKKRLSEAFANAGIDIKYISTPPTSEFPSGSQLDTRAQGESPSQFSSISSTSSLVPRDRFEFNVARGLQAFDLAVNISVENLLQSTAQKCSFKSDTTVRCGTELSPRRKRKYNSYSASATPIASERYSISPSPFISRFEEEAETPTPANLSRGLSLLPVTESASRSSLDRPSNIRFTFRKAVTKQEEWMERNRLHHLPWLEERLETCSRSSSFTIPMDVFDFETMTPLNYLTKYCRVDKGRERYYMSCLAKRLTKDKRISSIIFLDCLVDILLKVVEPREIAMLLRLVPDSNKMPIETRTFIVMAALAERILYAGYANIEQLNDYLDPRGFLERADFFGFRQKIENVNFTSKKLKRLLFSLS